MPRLYSERLSKMRGKDTVLDVPEGLSLEQAEERAISQNPDYFGKQQIAPRPQTPRQFLADPTIQMAVFGAAQKPKEAVEIAREFQELAGPPPATKIPDPARESLTSLQYGIDTNRQMRTLKQKAQINTGPVVNLLEWSGYYNLMDEKKPGAIKKYELDVMNPYRKLVTGAQASETELRKFIVPAIPNLGDNDQRFIQKSYIYHLTNIHNMKLILEGLKKQGYDVSEWEKGFKTRMIGMDGKTMHKADQEAVEWALENFASPEFREKAEVILRHNKIDPNDIMDFDTYVKEKPEIMQEMPESQRNRYTKERLKAFKKEDEKLME